MEIKEFFLLIAFLLYRINTGTVKNVFVSDGACMTSAANQNPSLTYMALTARAANHAVNELKRMNL